MGQPSGDSGTTTPPGGTNDQQGNSQGSSQGNSPAGQPNTAPNQQQTFTQADLDRIVQERLSRQKQQYADYDTLRERAQQWDKFVEESQSDQQKALSSARKEAEEAAWAKARSEFGSKLVEASLAAAAAGRLSESALSALLAGVDKNAFLTEGGDVDAAKVATFMDGIAPAGHSGTPGAAPGGFGQGARPTTTRPGLDAGRAEFARRIANGGAAPLIR